ncbi:MAG: hypothetical protein FJ320_03310 [SAR202 cluster bacterium]|nr:hypothetical protein [SAR202 cluster bacterium]
MPKKPYLYMVRVDVEASEQARFARWSDQRHMPDLLEIGFWAAVRYQSLLTLPAYLHLYEIPNLEIFNTQAYKYICRCDPSCPTLACKNKAGDPPTPTGPQITRHIKGISRAVYQELFDVGMGQPRPRPPGRRDDPVGYVRSKTIVTVAADFPPDVENEFVQWQQSVHMPRTVKAGLGITAGLLARRVDSLPFQAPKYLVLWEVKGPEVIQSNPSLGKYLQRPDIQRIWSRAQNRQDHLLQRIFPA